jgi:hypothetical protein
MTGCGHPSRSDACMFTSPHCCHESNPIPLVRSPLTPNCCARCKSPASTHRTCRPAKPRPVPVVRVVVVLAPSVTAPPAPSRRERRSPDRAKAQGWWWCWWWCSRATAGTGAGGARAAGSDRDDRNRPTPASAMLQNACFKYFKMFHRYVTSVSYVVAKVDRDVIYVAMVVHIYCKLLFLIFHLIF